MHHSTDVLDHSNLGELARLALKAPVRGVDKQTADDIRMSAFVKAVLSLPDLKDSECLKPWFYAIVRNETLQYFRSQKARLHLALPLDERVDFEDEDAATTFDVLLRSEIQSALATLPNGHQRQVVQRMADGESPSTIANDLHITESAVRGLYYRGTQALQRQLKVNSTVFK